MMNGPMGAGAGPFGPPPGMGAPNMNNVNNFFLIYLLKFDW